MFEHEKANLLHFPLALVAGEKSGDLLAAELIKAIKSNMPNATFHGIGGSAMQAQGLDCWWPMEQLSVSGYSEVISSLPKLLLLRYRLYQRILHLRPRAFIGVDAPDFNLRLEYKLKQKNIPTIHYISPSIWAWRKERLSFIKSAVDHVLTLLPMEKPLYDQAGISATYLGHPFADQIPTTINRQLSAQKLNIDDDKRVIALLPGSRIKEIKQMGTIFIETARLLWQQNNKSVFLVPLITRESYDTFHELLYQQNALDLPIRMLFGHPREAMAAAHGVLVTSGTATLEAALIKRPMVVAYRVSDFTYWLYQRQAYLPYFSLPNILSNEFVVPEFLQAQANPVNLAQALNNLINEKQLNQYFHDKFNQIHLQLRCNSAQVAADKICQLATSGLH